MVFVSSKLTRSNNFVKFGGRNKCFPANFQDWNQPLVDKCMECWQTASEYLTTLLTCVVFCSFRCRSVHLLPKFLSNGLAVCFQLLLSKLIQNVATLWLLNGFIVFH